MKQLQVNNELFFYNALTFGSIYIGAVHMYFQRELHIL